MKTLNKIIITLLIITSILQFIRIMTYTNPIINLMSTGALWATIITIAAAILIYTPAREV